MHSAQPLDILFEEAGASLGRIERELRLKDEARAARFEARLAAIELAAFKAEEERQRIFGERLAELRNGRDGEPGRDGKDADIEPLEVSVSERLASLRFAFAELESRIEGRLAEVKDGNDGEPGKDGEPGRDGKDGETPDLELVKQEIFNKVKAQVNHAFEAFQKSIEIKVAHVDARLAEVKDGKDGEPGPPGPPGKDGKMPISKIWTDTIHYEGEMVRHNGSTYQALKNTGKQPPHGDWGELASLLKDVRGFVLRGMYDAAAEYRQHDIVMLHRNSFAAKYDAPGDCPGDGWHLLGASGQKGKEGPPGAKGADGRSVSIASLEADADAMVLRITDSLGKTFSLDLEPIAERIVEAAR